jgi:aryl-alcohol dehydrogenase
MAGHLAGATPLIAVDVVEERLNLALELGATHILNAQQGDIAERIREIIPKGVAFSFETSANERAFKDAIACLGIRGECGFVAIPKMGETFPFTPQGLLRRCNALRGIIQGSAMPHTFLPRIIELNRQGRFPYDRLVSTYPFHDINKAFEDSKAGRAIKPVLIMDRL